VQSICLIHDIDDIPPLPQAQNCIFSVFVWITNCLEHFLLQKTGCLPFGSTPMSHVSLLYIRTVRIKVLYRWCILLDVKDAWTSICILDPPLRLQTYRKAKICDEFKDAGVPYDGEVNFKWFLQGRVDTVVAVSKKIWCANAAHVNFNIICIYNVCEIVKNSLKLSVK
jgi:hypothetical protein